MNLDYEIVYGYSTKIITLKNNLKFPFHLIILTENYLYLMDLRTNKNLICCIDVNFVNALKESLGNQVSLEMIGTAFDTFHNTQGDLCDKIATVVSHLLCNEFQNTADESCCCGCIKGTWGLTKKIMKKVIPVLPALIQVALLIAKEII